MSEDVAPQLSTVFTGARALGEALRRSGWTVAVAESCTGGLLGAAITAIPGSSMYMRGGVIAYADDVKLRLLEVDAATVREHGAVSQEVAGQMAAGVRRLLDADIGLSITGVAGPGDEGDGKPAGLVFVAAASPRGARTVRLDGDHGREDNRARAVRAALRLGVDQAGGEPDAPDVAR